MVVSPTDFAEQESEEKDVQLDSPEEEKKFEDLKQNPTEQIFKLLDELVVGEEQNKKVVFLIALSCKLNHPSGLRVVGDASIGKTHLVREVLELFPKKMKIVLGGASEKSLIHRKPDYTTPKFESYINLDEKILWFLEEKGGEKSYTILRPILSRDQEEIRFEITDKTFKTGKIVNKVVIIKGCPAFFTTSTQLGILEETGTRVFQITPDLSEEQTERIVDFKIDKERYLKKNPNLNYIRRYLYLLKRYAVWIPFIKLMKISCKNVRARRDFDKIVTLTKCIALLRQHQRDIIKINGEEHIVARICDYLDVISFLKYILEPTMENIPRPIIDFYNKIRVSEKNGQFDSNPTMSITGEKHASSLITHKTIAEVLGLSQHTARVYCDILYQKGWILMEKEGRENKYTLARKKHNLAILSDKSMDFKEIIQKDYDELTQNIKNKYMQLILTIDTHMYIDIYTIISNAYIYERNVDTPSLVQKETKESDMKKISLISDKNEEAKETIESDIPTDISDSKPDITSDSTRRMPLSKNDEMLNFIREKSKLNTKGCDVQDFVNKYNEESIIKLKNKGDITEAYSGFIRVFE